MRADRLRPVGMETASGHDGSRTRVPAGGGAGNGAGKDHPSGEGGTRQDADYECGQLFCAGRPAEKQFSSEVQARGSAGGHSGARQAIRRGNRGPVRDGRGSRRERPANAVEKKGRAVAAQGAGHAGR